jgi:hypothetical protein
VRDVAVVGGQHDLVPGSPLPPGDVVGHGLFIKDKQNE